MERGLKKAPIEHDTLGHQYPTKTSNMQELRVIERWKVG